MFLNTRYDLNTDMRMVNMTLIRPSTPDIRSKSQKLNGALGMNPS
mgnify:CR=1 FL=1